MAYRVRGRHVLGRVVEGSEAARVVYHVLELLADDPYNDPPRNALSIDRDPEHPEFFIVALGKHGVLRYWVDGRDGFLNLLDLVLLD